MVVVTVASREVILVLLLLLLFIIVEAGIVMVLVLLLPLLEVMLNAAGNGGQPGGLGAEGATCVRPRNRGETTGARVGRRCERAYAKEAVFHCHGPHVGHHVLGALVVGTRASAPEDAICQRVQSARLRVFRCAGESERFCACVLVFAVECFLT